MADNQNVSAEIAKLKKSHNRLVEQLGADSKAAKKAKMKLDAAEKKQASQSATAEAEEKATEPASKAKKAPKKSVKSSGDVRHVFEKKVEGGKEVKVIVASDETEAKGKLGDESFTFVKVITRGRSPKEGFVADKKAPAKKSKSAPKAKSAPAKRASKKDRTEVAKEAGMTAERAKKESDKVATAKKRGRKPMDKDAFLFEMPLKTKAGKVKRKVVVATSEASAKKQAGGRYTLVKKLAKGENPKTGIQEVEGYVKPAPKKRGRKPKSASPSLPAVTKKAEAIGEGIAIADKDLHKKAIGLITPVQSASDDLRRAMEDAERSISFLKSAVQNVAELTDIVESIIATSASTSKKKVEPSEVTEGLDLKKIYDEASYYYDFDEYTREEKDAIKESEGSESHAYSAITLPKNFPWQDAEIISSVEPDYFVEASDIWLAENGYDPKKYGLAMHSKFGKNAKLLLDVIAENDEGYFDVLFVSEKPSIEHPKHRDRYYHMIPPSDGNDGDDFDELDELVEEMKAEIAEKKSGNTFIDAKAFAESLDKLSKDIIRDEREEGGTSLVCLRKKFEGIGQDFEQVVRDMMLRGLDEEDIKIIMIGVSLEKIQLIGYGGIDGEVFGNYYENKNAKGNEYTHTGLFWYVGDSFTDAYDTISNNLDRGKLVIGFKYPRIDWDKALDDFDLKINPTPFLQLRRSDEDGQVYREAHISNNIIKEGTTYLAGAIGKTMAYPSMQKGEEGKLNLSYELQSEVERLISLPPYEPYLDYEVELTYDGGYVGLILPHVIGMSLFKDIVYGANMGIERSDGGEVYRNAYIKDFNVGFNFLGGIYEESKTNDVIVPATKEKIEELSQLFVK